MIRQPLRRLGEPLADRPHGDGGRPEKNADDDRVNRVVDAVGPVDERHEKAERRQLAQAARVEVRETQRQLREYLVRVGAVHPVRQDAHRGRRDDERDEAVAREQHEHVDDGDDDAADGAGDVVHVVALEPVDHAAEDRERHADRDVDARHEQHDPAFVQLSRPDTQHVVEKDCDDDRHQIRERAEAGVEAERRAEHLVEGSRVAPGAMLGDELHDGARVAHVEHGEIRRDRRRQHPEAVGGLAEVRDVEGQHEQPHEHLDADREVPRRQVDGDRARFRVGVDGALHCAPFAHKITFTVSTTIVRSNAIERCLM